MATRRQASVCTSSRSPNPTTTAAWPSWRAWAPPACSDVAIPTPPVVADERHRLLGERGHREVGGPPHHVGGVEPGRGRPPRWPTRRSARGTAPGPLSAPRRPSSATLPRGHQHDGGGRPRSGLPVDRALGVTEWAGVDPAGAVASRRRSTWPSGRGCGHRRARPDRRPGCRARPASSTPASRRRETQSQRRRLPMGPTYPTSVARGPPGSRTWRRGSARTQHLTQG